MPWNPRSELDNGHELPPNGVSVRRLLVSSVSPCSPAERAGSLKRGDELLSANGVVEHEDSQGHAPLWKPISNCHALVEDPCIG